MKFSEVYRKYSEDEYLEFDRVKNKASLRPDVNAFVVLDNLFPSDGDLVSCAEHDEIWLNVEPNELDILSLEQMLDLIRCGVRYDPETDSLTMFV